MIEQCKKFDKITIDGFFSHVLHSFAIKLSQEEHALFYVIFDTMEAIMEAIP